MLRWLIVAIGVFCTGRASAGDVIAIAPGVDLIAGSFVPNRQPDGNSLVLRARDGLVVIDTGRHAGHTQKILDYAKIVNLPIKAVINSHWHLDHIGGNPRVRAAFPEVKIYSSGAIDEAMHGFLANYRKQLEGAIAQSKDDAQIAAWRSEILLIDAGHALYPDVVIEKTQTRRIAGRELVLHLQAHAVTAGDVWVFDPSARVLAAGDLVTLPVPFLDTACPARWDTALDDLAHTEFKTLIPGHGAPMSRAQFATYRVAYANLLACAASDKTKTACADGWLADAKALLADADPAFVKRLLDYYIDNSLRVPTAQRDKLCGTAAST
ncbi:MAG: MBL fold metallo-hydrolase [Gammaproteobacteria bacterium]|nr:MAG: MBL fold metallo-hydrolase [Gammaproteobacteria bacterium]